MQRKSFYPLTDDICFKYIFGREPILVDFLNSFFAFIGENKKVLTLKVTTNKEMFGSSKIKKVFYGDILAYLDTDEIVSIEMYTHFSELEYKKSVSYLTRLFSDQLEVGESYDQAKKVISLNFMEGNYHFNNFQLINDYGLVNKLNYGRIKDECLEMYLVRLDLVKEMVYTKKEERFIKWLKLIKAEGMKEMEEISKEDKNMEQALRFMERFVNDEEVRNLYDKINDVEYYARKEGHDSGLAEGKEAGRAEGRVEGIQNTAKNMLMDGLSIKSIMKYTGLSKDEIEALK